VSEGLFYPNGMWRDSGQLWVANTEDEQIVSVATRPELGAEVARSAYDRDPEGSNRRPIELAPVRDQWWVVEIAGRLVGESVARFDNDWQPIGSLDLSEAAQPTTLVPHEGAVYVADAGRFRVHRFEPDGSPAGELEWRALQGHLADARAAKQFYTWTGHGLWAVFVALVAGGLVVGYRQGAIPAAQVDGVPLHALGIGAGDPAIEWIDRAKRMPMGRRTLVGVVIASCLVAVVLPVAAGWAWEVVQLSALLLLMAGLLWLLRRPLLDTRIGTYDGWLILDNGWRQVAGRGDAVDYTEYGVAIDDVAVPFGQPGRRLFSQEQLDEQVMPILGRATPISQSRWQLRLVRAYPAISGALGLLVVGFLAWLGFFGPIA
jgi:hypothetical protein